MQDITGQHFHKYKILESLGEGGMARVYRAQQLGKIKREVALKILSPHFLHNSEILERFKQEANMLARLQHPHILPIFDYGEAEGFVYLVMPFIKGGTLAHLLQGQPLPLGQVRRIMIQLAKALDYAHAIGLVHRDIKPSNVLLDERQNVLLADFGISKIIEGTANLTRTGGILGTPEYMSPEQGRGEVLDGRSDLYSLGIILYEMVTGRVPFRAETPIAIIFKHNQEPLQLPTQLNPSLPYEVEQVVLKVLAKNPANRYQTGNKLAQAIQQTISEDGGGYLPAFTPSSSSLPVTNSDTQVAPKVTPSEPTIPVDNQATQQDLSKWWQWGGMFLLLAILGAWFFFSGGQEMARSTPTITNITNSIALVDHTPTSTATNLPTVSSTIVPSETPIATEMPVVATPSPTIPPTLSLSPSSTPPISWLVSVSSANIRQGPSIFCPFVNNLAEGISVNPIAQYLNKENEIWYQIQQDEVLLGWMHESVLTISLAEKEQLPLATNVTICDTPTPQPASWAWEQGSNPDSSYTRTSNGFVLFSGAYTSQFNTTWTAPTLSRQITGDFDVQTRVQLVAFEAFQNAILGVRLPSENSWLRASLGFTSASFSGFDGMAVSAINTENGTSALLSETAYPNQTIYLRIVRNGSNFTLFYSGDKVSWQNLATISKLDAPNTIDIYLSVTTTVDKPTSATFSDLMVTNQ